MAATSPREDAIIDYLRRQFGPRLGRTSRWARAWKPLPAVGASTEVDAAKRERPEIYEGKIGWYLPTFEDGPRLFCGMLGTIAGNVALIFGARGGVYIAGGIALGSRTHSALRISCSVSKAKAGFRTYLQSVRLDYHTPRRYLCWFAVRSRIASWNATGGPGVEGP